MGREGGIARRGIVLSWALVASGLLASADARAQTTAPSPTDDYVFLSNGGRLRGLVMEEDPTKGVRIKLLDGTVRTVPPGELKAIKYGSSPAAPSSPPASTAPPAPSPPPASASPAPAAATPAPGLPPATGNAPATTPEPTASATPENPPPPSSAAWSPPGSDAPDRLAKARRAKFSAGRFIVESLASGAVGGLAGYGTLKAACGDTPCLGGAIGGMVVNIGITPLAAWGLGEAMGGDGKLGTTYMLGLTPFSVGVAATADVDPLVLLGIEMFFEPFCAALGYELSSHMQAKAILGPNGSIRPQVSPLLGRDDRLQGATGGVSATF